MQCMRQATSLPSDSELKRSPSRGINRMLVNAKGNNIASRLHMWIKYIRTSIHKRWHTTERDLSIVIECEGEVSVWSLSNFACNHKVVSVINVKEGPRAGFLSKVSEPWLAVSLMTLSFQLALSDQFTVMAVLTMTVVAKVWAKACNWRIKSIIMACPWAETALSNGPRRGVIVSITKNWRWD